MTGEGVPSRAVLDACVLFPASIRDLLMSLAVEGLLEPRWTEAIHEEWIENVLEEDSKRNDPPRLDRAKLEHTRDLMDAAAEGSRVEGYAHRIAALSLPDPDDRHVLAAALESEASVIVTFNLRHFPVAALGPLGVEARHPDAFLCALFDAEPERFHAVVRKLLTRLTNPPRTLRQQCEKLRSVWLPELAARLERLAGAV
jgi:predicted nucleic acid-binding protein